MRARVTRRNTETLGFHRIVENRRAELPIPGKTRTNVTRVRAEGPGTNVSRRRRLDRFVESRIDKQRDCAIGCIHCARFSRGAAMNTIEALREQDVSGLETS